MERRVNLSECLKERKMKNCCRRDVKMNSLEAKSGAVSIWDNYSAFPTSLRLFFTGLTMKVITMRCFITRNDTSPRVSFPVLPRRLKAGKAEEGWWWGGAEVRGRLNAGASGRNTNQNNQRHTQLPRSQKVISRLPKEVKEDYVGEIMRQNVTNRLIILRMRIRVCV